MTREEVAKLLFTAVRVLEEMRLILPADKAEQALIRLQQGMSAEDLALYSEGILPRGKRGHVRLVLLPPAEARADAFIACLLRSMT